MKLYDKLPLKKAYYRIFTGMIMFPLLLVLVLSLVLLGKTISGSGDRKYPRCAAGCGRRGPVGCGVHVHAPVPVDERE